VLVGIAMLLYLPTREFLKITCITGVPVVFLILFLGKQIRYSITWIAAMILLLAFLGGYGYLLISLPERIEVRRITTEGSMLVAEGKYDAAIAEYRKLDKLGKKDKMDDKVAEVEREKNAHRDVELARQLVKVKDYQEARKLLEAIPRTTWAYRDAAKLLKSIPTE
jgi:tetratricopeptide (TPR) repeat protein